MNKKVTILGAGLVVKPMVDYLAKHGYEITVADIAFSKAKKLTDNHTNATPFQFNINNAEELDNLVQNSDIVVSLLPAIFHVKIAKKCIKHKKNMVTASYISPEMRQLDEAAKKAGIIILNEIGVDPGIDHMSAMKIFHQVEENGGKVISFMSYCGGLPAPEANTNPLGYKFSWAPKGVLKAAGNGAKYMKNGEIIEVEGKNLFANYWLVDVDGIGTLEAYPNRNSLDYVDLYNLKDVKTMYRGTFRNISHCDTWFTLSQMGFYKEDEIFENLTGTVKEFILTKMFKLNKGECLKTFLIEKFNLSKNGIILKKFEWLGFFDDSKIPIKKGGAIDVLTAIMLEKMSYEKGERDLLVLHHKFVAKYPNKTQKITSTMIDYGIPNGDSSMARTVSLPAAIAVRIILENKINLTGVYMPTLPEIYEPVLAELENLNIKLIEKFF
ncbi:MAG: saccharopine dehydrogenase [Candidatus Cloacimonetes bacterium]|jgi:saccharopine dehydrogenase-like NADP-dependent oxidoreductase|nr:saccharopine dehydrogenase [Candidatus Cloacimonadota bacterium]MBT6993819.1 saccharopine dehydrogenase [Candidatus Cloacimonadota bacterium]